MNGREAILAMLEGKVVVETPCPPRGACRYKIDHRGGVWALRPAHSEYQPGAFSGFGAYELYEEPNPHEAGTYAWAREEHKRGHDVTNDNPGFGHISHQAIWEELWLHPRDFETMTWRRA